MDVYGRMNDEGKGAYACEERQGSRSDARLSCVRAAPARAIFGEFESRKSKEEKRRT
jgi:hypothetical protein